MYGELCQGRVEVASRREYVRVLRELVARGAHGVMLGCTEIMPLIGQQDCPVPALDTTTIHAQAAVDFALATEAHS